MRRRARGHALCGQRSASVFALVAAAVLALHAPRGAVAQRETAGYASPVSTAPGDSGPFVTVADVLPDGTRCAETVEELAPLLALTLTPDIDAWAFPNGGAAAGAARVRYNISDFQAFVAHDHANRGELVMIHDNRMYYFGQRGDSVVARRAPTPEDRIQFEVHAWIGAMQWWFDEAVTAWGWTFPDCVFHYDVRDGNVCGNGHRCAAPTFTLWRQAGRDADIMVPYMYGVNHRRAGCPQRAARAHGRGVARMPGVRETLSCGAPR